MLEKIRKAWMVAADCFHQFHKFLETSLFHFLSCNFGFHDYILVHIGYDVGNYSYEGCDEMRDVRLAASILSERGG